MPTFREQVEQARATLNQFTVVRPLMATFAGWQGVAPFTGINLSGLDAQARVLNAVVELGHELVYVSSHDPETSTTICPPWFRQQQGTLANSSYPAGSVAVVNPLWPYAHVAAQVIAGMHTLYPSLFVPKTTTLTTATMTERYLLPSDVDEIVSVKWEDFPPQRAQRKVMRWTLDTASPDGNRYLHIEEVWQPGRPIIVTYRARPVIPTDVTTNPDWTVTGLPASASDLPVLFAIHQLLPAAESAKVQSASVEQNERNRLVQPGAASAASRRYGELFATRLNEEKRKLHDRFPPALHRTVN